MQPASPSCFSLYRIKRSISVERLEVYSKVEEAEASLLELEATQHQSGFLVAQDVTGQRWLALSGATVPEWHTRACCHASGIFLEAPPFRLPPSEPADSFFHLPPSTPLLGQSHVDVDAQTVAGVVIKPAWSKRDNTEDEKDRIFSAPNSGTPSQQDGENQRKSPNSESSTPKLIPASSSFPGASGIGMYFDGDDDDEEEGDGDLSWSLSARGGSRNQETPSPLSSQSLSHAHARSNSTPGNRFDLHYDGDDAESIDEALIHLRQQHVSAVDSETANPPPRERLRRGHSEEEDSQFHFDALDCTGLPESVQVNPCDPAVGRKQPPGAWLRKTAPEIPSIASSSSSSSGSGRSSGISKAPRRRPTPVAPHPLAHGPPGFGPLCGGL
jgi:hypothetical protein